MLSHTDTLSYLPVRTPTELETMREAGALVARALDAVAAAALPGVRLRELDELAQTLLREAGATSPFLGYTPAWAPTPFNGVLCLSPNEVVVHGRPTGRRLAEGDLLSIDCGAIVDGYNGDSAITISVGPMPPEDARLVEAAEAALGAGIAAAVPGASLLDVAQAIDAVVAASGFSHLPRHGGHGIGRAMHEPPFVANQPDPELELHRFILRAGNTIAIEPMLHAGGPDYRTAKDGWSILTRDRSRAAHVEHTIAVTDQGPQILTARPS